jgi:hypothetical protein
MEKTSGVAPRSRALAVALAWGICGIATMVLTIGLIGLARSGTIEWRSAVTLVGVWCIAATFLVMAAAIRVIHRLERESKPPGG